MRTVRPRPRRSDEQSRSPKKATDVAAKRAKIKDLVAQGKSLDEIKVAVGDPPPAQGKGGGRGGPGFASFTDVVYQELSKK